MEDPGADRLVNLLLDELLHLLLVCLLEGATQSLEGGTVLLVELYLDQILGLVAFAGKVLQN